MWDLRAAGYFDPIPEGEMSVAYYCICGPDHEDDACPQHGDPYPDEYDPDLAYEQSLERNEQYAWEEEQDMMRTFETDPIWGVHRG